MPLIATDLIRQEIAQRAQDPLRLHKLTPDQQAAHDAKANTIVIEGGNQSGKTCTSCYIVAKFALGLHPRAPKANRVVWYCTTTYDKFGEQAWKHIKNFLTLPGEGIFDKDKRRIQSIRWLTTTPESPQYIKVKGVDGFTTEIYIHTYAQGPGEFQAASIDLAVIDEECDEAILREVRARFLARPGIIIVAATPILGVAWLEDLRQAALESPTISHHRLRTMDNPVVNQAMVDEMYAVYKDRPEELRLRLEGVPYSNTGLVYQLAKEHICEPFYLDPGYWAFYRAIDHGFNNCACVWAAVHRSGDDVVVYRDYLGQRLRIRDNAAAIQNLGKYGQWTGGNERYHRSWIDPATRGSDAETGKRVIDLWKDAGIVALPAPDNRVMPGIERVKDLLATRGGPNGDRPKLRFFSTCQHLLKELRSYRWKEAREKGDEGKENPEKRGDHESDCLRYLVAAGLTYASIERYASDLDPVARAFLAQRNPKSEVRL